MTSSQGFAFEEIRYGTPAGRGSARFALAALAAAALLWIVPSPLSAAAPDVAPFDRLLKSAVSSGRIDYAKFRNNADFAAYLKALESFDPKGLATNDRLAFWINGYNALVIKNVLDNPGMKKPVDVQGFFDKKTFRIGGKSLTLNQIENDMIRKGFNEPLIHFGLVCAAKSCPPILPAAYTGSTVRTVLAANAKSYLASAQNRYDEKTKTLHLSKIFEWYKEDFGGSDKGIREFVKKYGTAAMQSAIKADPNVKIAWIEYDWNLNSK